MGGRAVKVLLPVLLLAPLSALAPASLAGPPEAPSGQMALDEVADGLRQYRKEKEKGKRLEWLRRLAPTGDPRVGVALGEALEALGVRDHLARHAEVDLIEEHYHTGGGRADAWWRENQADLRRRAKQLP